MRTGEEFRQQAKKKGIRSWYLRDCSLCKYPLAYLFSKDDVVFDAGCDCVSYHGLYNRDWDDVAQHYNMQKSPEVIKEMDEFWGFE